MTSRFKSKGKIENGRGSLHVQRKKPGRERKELGRHMDYFFQQLINGVSLGSIYGLIAIGYTMVYGIIGMINFSHGEIFMVGSFVSVIVLLILGVTSVTPVFVLVFALLLVCAIAMLVSSVYSWTVERVAYRRLRGSFRLAPLISAIGVSIFLQELVRIFQGPRPKPTPPLITGTVPLTSGDFVASISYIQILIIITTVVLMLVFSFLISKTTLGRCQRACEQDRKMAALLGVNVDKTISITFVIGAALAAVAGMMFNLYYGVIDFQIGFLAGIKAFTAAVLGGIGSIPGAMLGGLLIGLIETFWGAYFALEYKDVAAFSMLAIILIFLPQGLLGKPEIEKV